MRPVTVAPRAPPNRGWPRISQPPDDFLLSLFDAGPGYVCAAVKRQREGLRNPPKTAEELLATLESQGLLQTATRLRQFVELL